MIWRLKSSQKKDRLEEENFLELAKTKIKELAQKAQSKLDPKKYDLVMSKVDLSSLKGVRSAIDTLNTLIADAK